MTLDNIKEEIEKASKIVILTSVLLLGIGTVLFFIFEYNNLLKNMPFGQKLLNAFFASVTPRTAGFNSIDMAGLSPSSVLLTVFLMFIGGSSGSTAGGVKTTSIFVIIAFALSTIRGNNDVVVFGKTIKTEFLKKARADSQAAVCAFPFYLQVFAAVKQSSQ